MKHIHTRRRKIFPFHFQDYRLVLFCFIDLTKFNFQQSYREGTRIKQILIRLANTFKKFCKNRKTIMFHNVSHKIFLMSVLKYIHNFYIFCVKHWLLFYKTMLIIGNYEKKHFCNRFQICRSSGKPLFNILYMYVTYFVCVLRFTHFLCLSFPSPFHLLAEKDSIAAPHPFSVTMILRPLPFADPYSNHHKQLSPPRNHLILLFRHG